MLTSGLLLAAFSLLADAAAAQQTFTNSGEMDITSCPITYFGQKYEKLYVGFSGNRFAVCFKGLYSPGVQNDCILLSGGAADRGNLSVLSREIPTGSGVHKLLPNLKYAGKCVNVIPLSDSQLSPIGQVELGNFHQQSILAIKTYSGYTSVNMAADALVDGLTVSAHSFPTADTSRGVVTDVSGCRLSGRVYQSNTTAPDPTSCSTVTCHANGVATAESHCGPMERCGGGGSCVLSAVCSVSGSSVVGFGAALQVVPDRCAYSLLASSALNGLRLLGVFRDRSRRDTTWLDQVIVQLGGGTQISLKQGGFVEADGETLALSGGTQTLHGVEISRDRTGVTAKMAAANHSVTVLFDGLTSVIHITGPGGASLEGLCGDSGPDLSQDRVPELSAPDCETRYEEEEEAAGDSTSCNSSAEWCGRLLEAPFSFCHRDVDPRPFIQACTQTQCHLPPAGGAGCPLLEAYAQSCRLLSNVSLEAWRPAAGCSPGPQDGCMDKVCSHHEFCGVDRVTGETRCLCRAIFASQYQPSNSFGEPTVCGKKSASVTFANCLLENKGIDYSLLHLNDRSCKGELDNVTHMVTFGFDGDNSCGTVIQANSSHLIFRNTIKSGNISSPGGISRHGEVSMDFSCFHSQPEVESLAIKLRHSSVVQHLSSGEWNYTLSMRAYADRGRSQPVDPTADVRLNEKLWVELRAHGLDQKLVAVVTDSCWATDRPSPSGSPRYDLIVNGCPNPADRTVSMEGNGRGSSHFFSFNTFQFSGGNSGSVFLHCKVKLCVSQGDNCVQRCDQGHRERRSAMPEHRDIHSAFITMAWTY